MTFKAPTGAKHDRCIDHVPHAYPKSGKLCIGPSIGREGMIAFADEMAEKAAERRAAFLAERPERPESWYVGSGKSRKLRPIGEHRGHPVVPSVCDGSRCHGSSVHAHGGSDVFTPDARAGIAELAARFAAMRGRTVEPDTYVAAVARKARAPKAAPVALEPEPAEPVRHLLYADRRSFTYCAQPPTARSIAAPDHLGALSVLAHAGDAASLGRDLVAAGPTGES